MKLNKFISVCLASAVLITAFSGCGKQNSENNAMTFVDTDEKLTITWLGFPGNAGSEEGSPAELALEEKFNVDLVFEYFPSTAKRDTQYALLLAEGKYPDKTTDSHNHIH